MRMVEIKAGVYGRRDERGRVLPVTKGERVTLPDEEAVRLVGLGVAEVIGEGPAAPFGVPHSGGEDPPEDPSAVGGERASDGLSAAALERMTKADLEQMARDMGLDISGAKNNRERAELIAAAEADESYDPPEPEDEDIVR